MKRRRHLLAALAAAFACGCGDPAAPPLEVVRIAVPVDAPPAAAPTSASLWRGEHAVSVELGPPERPNPLDAWVVRSLRGEAGSDVSGDLVLGDGAAVLLYHLASRSPELPQAVFAANRLVVYEAGGERRLGIWLDSRPDAADRLPLSALDGEAGAAFIALAQALGATDVLTRDRVRRSAAGAPLLPLYRPASAGDARVLRDRSLEIFLPVGLASRLAASPALRTARDRELVRFAAALPALADAVERGAAELAVPNLAAPAAEVAALLRETAEIVAGYFDSVWVELLVRERPPDAAQLTLYVHNVAQVSLRGFEASLPHRQLLAESRALAALRMEPLADEPPIRAHLGPDGVSFGVPRVLPPRARGPYGFAGTRLEFELTGLAGVGASRRGLLDALRVALRNDVTDAEIPQGRVQRVASLEDPRYAVAGGAAEEPAAAVQALARVLESASDVAAPLRFDDAARRLVLAPGSYRLTADFVPPPGVGLLLPAGVTIRVEPGVSMLVRGSLTVAGTERDPVRIVAAADAPWGVLAVQGKGLGGLDPEPTRCAIRHLELSGGSEDELRGAFYSGQLSVHHADLELSHAGLSGATADDALNLKYGRAEIADSRFHDNAADAVDLDWAKGTIRRSVFSRSGSGGDGVDVSGSDVAIEDSLFSDVGDKCISVGEASRLMVRGSLLRRCATGIASKDLSEAFVRESVLLDNGRHFAAFVKKPIFGPARLAAIDVRVGAAESMEVRDADSRIETTALAELEPERIDALRAAGAFSRAEYRRIVGAERP